MKTVLLYGELARRFGRTHQFAIKNASEAIRALKANYRGFTEYMAGAHRQNVGFKVFVGGHRIGDYDELAHPSGATDVIRIVPVLVGSGNGWVKVLIGAVLVTAGVLALTVGAPFGLAPLGGPLISIGAALIIGGVAQLLTKPPEVPQQSETDRKNSFIFDGAVNTSAQGAPVPVGYGRLRVGSVVVSAGIETHEI